MRFSFTFTLPILTVLSHYSYPPLFFHTIHFFFSYFIPFSYAKLFSVSFTRFIGLLCSARAVLISLSSVSPSHLHSHDAFSSFLFLFCVRDPLVFLFFHVFTTAVELFSLLYLLFLILVFNSFLARTFRPTLSGISSSFSSFI